jgi:hypothetical protein
MRRRAKLSLDLSVGSETRIEGVLATTAHPARRVRVVGQVGEAPWVPAAAGRLRVRSTGSSPKVRLPPRAPPAGFARLASPQLCASRSQRGLIRFGGHLSCEGYDVQTDA